MNVILVHNKKSGGEYGRRQLRSTFKRHGLMIIEAFDVSQIDAPRYRTYLRKKVVVAVVGGDGTINAVARTIIGTQATLLPLPGGTFNHFVRDVGLSPNLEANLQNVQRFRRRSVDVAYVNDELFLNNSNIGLYPFSLDERKTLKRYTGKWIAAIVSAFDQFGRFRRRKLRIRNATVKSPFVFVGNGNYDIAGNLIPARDGVSAATLTIMLSSAASRRDLIAGFLAVLRGDVSNRHDFHVEHHQKLTIDSPHKRLAISLDGEVRKLTPPLRYRVEQAALQILAPPNK